VLQNHIFTGIDLQELVLVSVVQLLF